MRIAQIAPLTEAVPPKLYGGTERVVSWLTESLVSQGHEVTLFASGDSITAAKLEAVCPRALRLAGAGDAHALHMMMIELVARRAAEFDLIHFHLDYFPFSLFLASTHALSHHACTAGSTFPNISRCSASFLPAPVVSISKCSAASAARAPTGSGRCITVSRAIFSRPRACARLTLRFLAARRPKRGSINAIAIARRCGIPLKIAAKVDTYDSAYFNETIRPVLGQDGVEFIGEIGDAEKSNFLSGALGLLMPIDWPEPFGLVMIEAMACGTPVIAFDRGAASEVIEDGLTGFIAKDMAEFIHAVPLLGRLSRPSFAAASRRGSSRTAWPRTTCGFIARLWTRTPGQGTGNTGASCPANAAPARKYPRQRHRASARRSERPAAKLSVTDFAAS